MTYDDHDLTAMSAEILASQGNHPQMAFEI